MKNESKYKFILENYGHLFDNERRGLISMFGIECRDGWYDIIHTLIGRIDNYIKNKPQFKDFKIVQIKEKFGGLRVYVDDGDDVIHELISLIEGMSFHICEYCGSNQQVTRSKGWMITACKKCIDTEEELKGREWIDIG